MRTEAVIAPIADDMQRIFAPLAGRPVPPAPQMAARSTGQRRWVVVMPALIAFAGGGAFAVAYGLGTVPPVQAPDRPVGRVPAAPSPMVDRQMAPNDAGPATAFVAPPTTAPSPAASPLATPIETSSPPASSPRSDPPAVVSQDNVERPTERRCRPGSPENHCIYRDVMTADARLRRAYERAADAGVSSSRLASVNRRWERARDDSRDDPDGAIDRYDRLADALDSERDGLQ